jgi:hypothetical protein
MSFLSSEKRFVRVGLGIFLVWFILGACISLSDWIGHETRCDFSRYSLAASRTLFSGGDPYSREDAQTSYKYFPLNAVLLGPFTKVPDPVAQGFWTATNLMLLGACLWAHRKLWAKDLRVPWWVWGVALAVGLRFFVKNIRLGQWNTSVYCLSFLGLTAIWACRERFGAWLVALSAALKYLPSFFVLYLAMRRKWKPAAWMIIAYLFWVLVFPTLVLGVERHTELLGRFYLRATKQYQGMTSPDYTSSHSLRSTLMRMTSEVKPRLPDPDVYDFTVITLPKEVAKRLSEVVAYAVLGLTIGITLFVTRNETSFQRSVDNWAASGETSRGVNLLRELLLIGLWYTTLLMISPETRQPHFLTLFTPSFALALWLANVSVHPSVRKIVTVLVAAGIFFILTPSEIFHHARYHLIASGLGFYAWAQVAFWLASALAIVSMVQRFSHRSGNEMPESE